MEKNHPTIPFDKTHQEIVYAVGRLGILNAATMEAVDGRSHLNGVDVAWDPAGELVVLRHQPLFKKPPPKQRTGDEEGVSSDISDLYESSGIGREATPVVASEEFLEVVFVEGNRSWRVPLGGRLTAACLSDSARLLAAQVDQTVRIWKVGGNRLQQLDLGFDAGGPSGPAGPGGAAPTGLGDDDVASLGSGRPHAALAKVAPHARRILRFSRDERLLVWSARGMTTAWKTATGERAVPPSPSGRLLDVSPDGRRLAFAGPNLVVLVSVSDRRVVKISRATGSTAGAFLVGGTVFCDTDGRQIRFWTTSAGDLIHAQKLDDATSEGVRAANRILWNKASKLLTIIDSVRGETDFWRPGVRTLPPIRIRTGRTYQAVAAERFARQGQLAFALDLVETTTLVSHLLPAEIPIRSASDDFGLEDALSEVADGSEGDFGYGGLSMDADSGAGDVPTLGQLHRENRFRDLYAVFVHPKFRPRSREIYVLVRSKLDQDVRAKAGAAIASCQSVTDPARRLVAEHHFYRDFPALFLPRDFVNKQKQLQDTRRSLAAKLIQKARAQLNTKRPVEKGGRRRCSNE